MNVENEPFFLYCSEHSLVSNTSCVGKTISVSECVSECRVHSEIVSICKCLCSTQRN